MSHLLLCLAMLAGAAESAQVGCTIEPPGFVAAEFAVGVELDGLAHFPGGPYGAHLYAAANGAVLRIDPVRESCASSP